MPGGAVASRYASRPVNSMPVKRNMKTLKEMAERSGKSGMIGIGPDVERLDEPGE